MLRIPLPRCLRLGRGYLLEHRISRVRYCLESSQTFPVVEEPQLFSTISFLAQPLCVVLLLFLELGLIFYRFHP